MRSRYMPLFSFIASMLVSGCGMFQSSPSTYYLIVDFDSVSKKHSSSPSYVLKETLPELNLESTSDLQWESDYTLIDDKKVSSMTLRGKEGQYFHFWIKKEDLNFVILSFQVKDLNVVLKGTEDEELIVKDINGSVIASGNLIELQDGDSVYYIYPIGPESVTSGPSI